MPAHDDVVPLRPQRISKTSVLYVLLFLLACFYVVQSTMVNDTPYINLHVWGQGHEKLPYQRRDLLAPLLRAAEHNHTLMQHAAAQHGLGTFADPLNYPLFFINLASLILCGLMATLMYRYASRGPLWWLPSSLLLILFIVSVSLRWEHRYLFPYDMLSMFFFTLGLFCIYCDRAWLLIPLMPIATANRETTIMWIPLLLLFAWHRHKTPHESLQSRRHVLVPLFIAAALAVIWLLTVHHMAAPFLHNDASENYPRFFKNLHALLTLKGVIESVSAFAFSVPFLFIFRNRITDPLLKTFFPILPLWILIMLYQGEIVESRVFAELFPYAAVTATLILQKTYLPLDSDTVRRPSDASTGGDC